MKYITKEMIDEMNNAIHKKNQEYKKFFDKLSPRKKTIFRNINNILEE